MSSLLIKNLRVSVEDKLILKDLSLEVKQGEIHAIMGPNGSGKSTMAYALAGHPKYEVEGGEVWMDGVNLLELPPDEPETDHCGECQRITELPVQLRHMLKVHAVNAPYQRRHGDQRRIRRQSFRDLALLQ